MVSLGLTVRDPDGLLHPVCFTHAVQRAMKGEPIHEYRPSDGEECIDCTPYQTRVDLAARAQEDNRCE